MRIGVMLRTYEDRQGIGIYCRNLMDALLPLDSRNSYVLYYRNPQLIGTYSRFPQVTEKVVSAPSKVLWDQVQIPLAARKDHLDLIFHPKFTVPFVTRRKTAMTIHGASWFVHPELYDPLGIAYIKAFMPLYCRKADLILSNSRLTTDDFIRILKVPPEKIATIPLGTNRNFKVIDDRPALDAYRQRHNLPEKFLVSVIRYDPRKNFKNLIAAFRLLRKRTPCKLVVTGIGCEKYREEYRLEEDGTADDVQFLGWVEPSELPLLYTLAHGLFFPSVYEEFGIPVCEAMACGCPPVVSQTGALPEVAGDAGLIVDPFNPATMADALERLWTNPALRADLVHRCLARAAEFTWDRCAQDTLTAFNRLA
jgi:glycosyltransferase involved in cell wall biosynthesis